MKQRTILLALCMVLLLSALSPLALAAGSEPTTPGDDPVEPEPYLHIDSILVDFEILDDGTSSDYASVLMTDSAYHCTLTLRLKRAPLGSRYTDDFSTIKLWSKDSGTPSKTYLEKEWPVTAGYSYLLSATVSVYDSNEVLCESRTKYSYVVDYDP